MHTPFRYSNQTVRRIDRSRDRGMLRSDRREIGYIPAAAAILEERT